MHRRLSCRAIFLGSITYASSHRYQSCLCSVTRWHHPTSPSRRGGINRGRLLKLICRYRVRYPKPSPPFALKWPLSTHRQDVFQLCFQSMKVSTNLCPNPSGIFISPALPSSVLITPVSVEISPKAFPLPSSPPSPSFLPR